MAEIKSCVSLISDEPTNGVQDNTVGRLMQMRSRSAGTRVLLFLSVIFTNLTISKIHASIIGDYDLSSSNRFVWILAYSLLCFVVLYSFGLPDRTSWRDRFTASFASVLTSALLISTLQVVIGQLVLPRFVIATSIPGVFAVSIIVSFLTTWLNQNIASKERILLISSLDDAKIIDEDLAFHTEIPCVISKHLTVADALKSHNFLEIISVDNITLVVVDGEAARDGKIVSLLTDLHSQGVRIRSQLSFYNDWIGKVPVRELGETALLFDIREIHHLGYSRVSRMIDVVIASFGLIALAVVTPLVLIGNLIGNHGPLFYFQERVGKGQISFQILKFRSMIQGELASEWTQKNDSRITKFGKFLRLSHIDELPQVINILRGDLSIVGPRPEQSHYVEQLALTIPYYLSRHLVRPGLTGWAQINYPYGADEIDAFEKLQYEFWYLQHQSMWLDLRIIARTFRHVLGFKGR